MTNPQKHSPVTGAFTADTRKVEARAAGLSPPADGGFNVFPGKELVVMTKQRMRVGTLALVLSLCALMASPAMAQDKKRDRPDRPHRRQMMQHGGMANPLMLYIGGIHHALHDKTELQLTDDQKTKIRTIAQSHRDEMQKNRQAVRQAGEALQKAVMADNPDTQQIRSAAEALGKAIGDAAVAVAPAIHDVRGVLTADQLKQVQTFQQEMQKRMKERGQHKAHHKKGKAHQKQNENQDQDNGDG